MGDFVKSRTVRGMVKPAAQSLSTCSRPPSEGAVAVRRKPVATFGSSSGSLARPTSDPAATGSTYRHGPDPPQQDGAPPDNTPPDSTPPLRPQPLRQQVQPRICLP